MGLFIIYTYLTVFILKLHRNVYNKKKIDKYI